ncbi:MAG: hypothetical protein GX444_09710 [Myxococcales bacterium]|nr:hypothetical protein [Myxococcales bacterium]
MDERARWEKRIALLVLLAAEIAICAGLTSHEIYGMEAQDLGLARNLYTNGKFNLPADQSPLGYILLNAAHRLDETSVFVWRLPAATFVALAALLLYLMVRREAGRTAGLLAALFLTINPLTLELARQARMYGLVIGLAAWCLYQAQLYLTVTPRRRYLAGIVLGAVAGVYTHLFFLLFAGALAGLLVVVQARQWRDWRGWARLAVAGAAGLVAILPQLWRLSRVLGFTANRHQAFPGLSPRPDLFFRSLSRELFFANEMSSPWLFGLFGALVLAGLIVWKKRGLLVGGCLILPVIGGLWGLSFSHPVDTRYVCFLLPIIAACLAMPAARLRAIWGWAPLALLVALPTLAAAERHFTPSTDWRAAGEYIRDRRAPGEPTAVFPDFFKWTFAGYGGDPDAVDISSPDELDRVLARGQRTFLVAGPGRYFGAINAHLKSHVHPQEFFTTKVREKVEVRVLQSDLPRSFDLPPTDDPSLLLTGVIGSGGYPWQDDRTWQDPFARLQGLLRQADLTLALYESLAPGRDNWVRRLFGHPALPARETNVAVLGRLKQAGIDAVALLPIRNPEGDPRVPFDAAGLQAFPAAAELAKAKPGILPLRDRRLVVLNLGQAVSLEKPHHRRKKEAGLADLEQAVREARQQAGDGDRLLVLLPQKINHDRCVGREDQMLARRAIDLGADVVVGAGGRVAREIETYRNGLILHSPGVFLTPPVGNGWASSRGFVVRLRFPAGEPPRCDVVPVTFDDLGRPAFARPAEGEGLNFQPSQPAEENLVDRLIEARVSSSKSDSKPVNATNWIGVLQASTSIHEGYRSSQGASVGAGNVRSLGEYRRALVFEPGRAGGVAATFDDLLLGESVRLAFGIVDSAFQALFQPHDIPQVEFLVGDEVLFAAPLKYAPGWRRTEVDTSAFAGERRPVTIRVGPFGKAKFPVAVAAVIARSPQTLKVREAEPYAFRERFDEARVFVETPDGNRAACAGPDESFRWLRNEEKGFFAEGVLYRRLYCSADLWDAAALTRQKSGRDLRPAIWLHPLTGAKRHLVYGPLPVRARLRGYFGFTDLAVKMKKGSVDFSIRVGGEEIYRVTAANRGGWRDFEVSIPPRWRGKEAEISFLAEAPDQSWRHFCFNAWME